jgi:hypothetical protein
MQVRGERSMVFVVHSYVTLHDFIASLGSHNKSQGIGNAFS